jgi:mannitol/fructose-specific phosphotransferase system IIA component (Ntr-type)
MISTYLQVVNIQLNLDAKDIESVIDQMTYLASRNNVIDDLDDLKTCLKNREKKRTTGFGKGVALPHALTRKLREIVISVAILSNPVEWNSLDKRPVNIVAMVSGPTKMMTDYMKVLFDISKILADDSARNDITEQPNIQGVFDAITRYDKALNQR